MSHTIKWRSASPLWDEALKDEGDERFRQPAILRFASDTFMEDLTELLSKAPMELKDLVARYETWSDGEDEAVGWLSRKDASLARMLKLYQPVHGRFYLVAASLVCLTPGLPDRFVDTASGEKVSFVLRRKAGTTEYGWAANGENKGWTPASSDGLVDAEERLPMFPINFQCPKKCDVRRRLFVGFIPVGSRETYQAAPALSVFNISAEDLEGDDMSDPRLVEFQTRVIEGIDSLEEALNVNPIPLSISEAQAVLLFICLDFAELLKNYVPDLTTTDLYTGLNSTSFSTGANGKSWYQALQMTLNQKDDIMSGKAEDSESTVSFVTDDLADYQDIMDAMDELVNMDVDQAGLVELVSNAFGTYEKPEEKTDPVEIPKMDPSAGSVYTIRCVYERPLCEEVIPPVVSEGTQPFQLASFFDPDAPARPLQITMPIDTSISGLRKFPKNVSFLISNKLRQQIERIRDKKLKDLDDGEIEQGDGINLGMICSLSIPIITICAMILLMIIVQLLNIVFWWLPFFKICFPIILKKSE